MDNDFEIENFRRLREDLLALSESRLQNVERLLLEAQARIVDFRRLLDEPPKNEQSRKVILSGRLKIEEVEYAINEDFQQEALELADLLDLDEVKAGHILLKAQHDADELDRSIFESAIFEFHERRFLLLDTLCLMLSPSVTESDIEQSLSEKGDISLKTILKDILKADTSTSDNGVWFAQKCAEAMRHTEDWLRNLNERVQRILVLGDTQVPGTMEMIECQRRSLERQHEVLGSISCRLVKAGFSTLEDFKKLLLKVRTFDKLDIITVHYIPLLMASISSHGSADGHASQADARALHAALTVRDDNKRWSSSSFHATTICWWLAEYETWYLDHPSGASFEGIDLVQERDEREKLYMECLKDNALQFMLSVCAGTNIDDYRKPSRTALLSVLLQDPPLVSETIPTSGNFQRLLMEQLQSYIDAFINNMPDIVRKLRNNDDSDVASTIENAVSSPIQTHRQRRMYLETFEVIIAFAFRNHPEESQDFWKDTEGVLFGFLKWASTRESMTQASAFCEMLCAISHGEENATSAHAFLEENGDAPATRIRRSLSLTYAQIFAELDLFDRRSHDRSPLAIDHPFHQQSKPTNEVLNEPETTMILASYLRLIAHLARQSITVRAFVFENSEFQLVPTVLHLTSSGKATIHYYLRAAMFDLLEALLTDKTNEISNAMWTYLDQWMSAGPITPLNRPKSAHLSFEPQQSIQFTLFRIANNLEEVTPFVGLLFTLISPSSTDSGSRELLSFPENLGSTYRMAGVNPYIDLVFQLMIEVYTTESYDARTLQVLKLNLFNFVATCLSTFNENAVILASKSNTSTSIGLKTPLSSYIRLHPFGRVMEWIMTEKVANILCEAVNQDVTRIANASEDASLYLALLRNIETLTFVLDLQATYVNIVRPAIKPQSGSEKTFGSPLATFEESVINNLHLVAVLGLYCGTGHQDLILASLALLRRLCGSRRLNSVRSSSLLRGPKMGKIIEILQLDMEGDRISRSLNASMQPNLHEIEEGPGCQSCNLKLSIIDFLSSCLDFSPKEPTIAHLLFGFSCTNMGLDIVPGSLFDKGLSLFHTVLGLLQQYPQRDGDVMLGWLLHLRVGCLKLLEHLWASDFCCSLVIPELRSNGFLFLQFCQEAPIDRNTLWDGRPLESVDFYYTDSGHCLADFLCQRSLFLEYACTDIRLAISQKTVAQKLTTVSTLLGMTPSSTEQSVSHANIFDLFDFTDLLLDGKIDQPQLRYFVDIDLKYAIEEEYGGLQALNLQILDELIQFHSSMLREKFNPKHEDEQKIVEESHALFHYISACNRRFLVRKNRSLALKAWTKLVTVVLEDGGLDAKTKTEFILQSLQIITPKFEMFMNENQSEAFDLAELAELLLRQLESSSSLAEYTKYNDLADKHTFELFQVCLRGLRLAGAASRLREACYGICYDFLRRINDQPAGRFDLRVQTMQAIKSSGERLFNAIGEDAYTGDQNSRLSALALLETFLTFARQQCSSYIVDILNRLNIIYLLVESIRHIAQELGEADSQDIEFLFTCNRARLSLLLNMSRTKKGATYIFNSGIFQAIQDSQLFAVDLDVGIDVDNSDALFNFYTLLLSVVTLINSIVITRSENNEQTIDQARKFVTANRFSIVGAFKRDAGISGSVPKYIEGVLQELIENYTFLLSAVDFLEARLPS